MIRLSSYYIDQRWHLDLRSMLETLSLAVYLDNLIVNYPSDQLLLNFINNFLETFRACLLGK